jgi:hypothetical protein
LEQLYF